MKNVIDIDRSVPPKLETFGDICINDYYVIESQDPAYLATTRIDLSKIGLELLFDGDSMPFADINTIIQTKLAGLKISGHVFLDAKILEAFISNPALFPLEWTELADADSASGFIRFDGTVLKLKRDQSLHVFYPFFARGYWVGGRIQQYYSADEVSKMNGLSFFRLFTAVIKPNTATAQPGSAADANTGRG